MFTVDARDFALINLLNQHPEIKTRMETLVYAVASVDSDGFQRADDVELYVRNCVRQLGADTLAAWAERKALLEANKAILSGCKKHCKKKSIGTQSLEESKL